MNVNIKEAYVRKGGLFPKYFDSNDNRPIAEMVFNYKYNDDIGLMERQGLSTLSVQVIMQLAGTVAIVAMCYIII